MHINLILLGTMVIFALWTVTAKSLLKAMIALAVASVIISILMFRLNAPLAGVFELSVCAGLVTAIFASAISLTKPLSYQETKELTKNRYKKYWLLPVLAIGAAAVVYFLCKPVINISLPQNTTTLNVREVFWNLRHMDIFGQIILIILGAVGVTVLFKEAAPKKQ